MSSTGKTADRGYVWFDHSQLKPSETSYHMYEYTPSMTTLFPDAVEAFRGSIFGYGTGPIFLDSLDCSGTENSLIDCDRYAGLGLHSCDHSEDAGVSCIGKKIDAVWYSLFCLNFIKVNFDCCT